MPSPSIQKTILSLPFSTGLSQKESPQWLAQGALLVAQNAVHPKTNVLAKRPGATALTRGFIPQNRSVLGGTIVQGKRLAVDGDRLLMVGKDQWTDAVFAFDEQSQTWIFVDRIPEVYAYPDRTVMAFDDTIREMDVAVCNGYRVTLCLVSANSGNATGRVFYKVENAATGETIVAQQLLDATIPAGNDQQAGKLIVCGATVIAGLMTGKVSTGPGSGTLSLNLYSMNMATPWASWYGPTAITGIANPTSQPGVSGGAAAIMGGWDIASASSSQYVILYQLAGGNILTMGVGAVAYPPPLPSVQPLTDAGFSADGSPYVQAFGLDVSSNLAGISYAYISTSGVLRVKVQQWDWSALLSKSSPVDLMSSPGPTGQSGLTPYQMCPSTIAIAKIGAFANAYRVAWSPNQAAWSPLAPNGNAGLLSAFIGIWTVFCGIFPSTTSTVAPNSPRLTWGPAVASRWLPNVNGIGYIGGRVPSTEQGTHFLFADDAWQDVTSLNGGSAPTSYFPLRCVGTFAARLSSVLLPTDIFAPFSARQDIYQPHALPHIVANPGAAGVSVYETLISYSNTVQSQSPALLAFDMASPLNHQNAVLGQNTGFSCAQPSLCDGARVHGFAFPCYPSISTVSVTIGTAVFLPGTYSYIAIYDWLDARGQLHRSGRSAAQSYVSAGNNAAAFQVVVSCAGFTDKEKALLASSNTASPQSNGATGTPVTVRLYRTQANGEIYYEVASQQNQQGSPYVSFVDNIPDSEIATNTQLYGDGLNAEMPGAILDNLCPPAFQGLIVHRNRFVGIDGKNVWATKELTDGEGAGFNELEAFSWDDGPNITGALSIDDKCILWKEQSVGYFTGQGPQDDGGQNDWSPVVEIASDTGAIDWRSLVLLNDGVYFDSPAGRRMLSRDLQVTPVPNVEDTLVANPATTSAILHPTQGRCLTTSNTDDVTAPRVGVVVDKHYVLDGWFTQLPIEGAVSAIVADTPAGPTYHYLGESGACYREQKGGYLDNGNYVPTQVETAWVKAEGIEGFSRFGRLQVTWQALDAHALTLYVAFDYRSTYYLMGTVTWAMMQAMPGYAFGGMCAQQFDPMRRRGQAIRFKAVDSADLVTNPSIGQGGVLISMGLEVAAYTNRKLNRLTAAQRT